jgi:fatty-acyl-CoA synthase
MMDVQLNSWLLFAHAETHNRHAEIVTRLPDGSVVRHTYGEWARRTQQLMHALDDLGLDRGAHIATLAWNTFRHLEAYFAVPCTGRVLHTGNIRLSSEELRYLLDHAGDQAVLIDPDLLPLLEPIRDSLPKLRHVIVLGDEVPATSIEGVLAYEQLLDGRPQRYDPIDIEEHTPLGLCYTSGTTGRPKAAVYTHRSTFLHSQAVAGPAGMRIGRQDCVLPVVPMFHANAWGMPYAAISNGAKLVVYGGALQPADFVDLLLAEQVTVAAGVPTVWLAVADELAARGGALPALSHIACGGSQPPPALIERYRTEFGVDIVQAWGMTETSPLASVAWPQHRMRDWTDEQLTAAVRCQAGLPLPGIEISIRDEHGNEVPTDGATMGDLYVRGPWVIDAYLHGDGAENFSSDGWFATGDVAIGSPDGYFVIADRTKNLIKSGGEWISSVDMEAAIIAMPQVAEAAVIAVPDPKWQERPLAAIVLRPGSTLTLDEVRGHLLHHGFASWQLPDRIEFIDEVPKTAVGKFDKKVLRGRFA